MLRERDQCSERPVLDVSNLKHTAFGVRSLVWWGTFGLIVIEGTMFAIVIATYFYLRTHAGAPRFRVVATKLDHPDVAAAREVVPASSAVIEDLRIAGEYLLVHVSPQQFRRAWQMRQKYHDKPDISFVDFTSMVIMQDLGITDVFTGDAHFQQANLGFRLLP